MRTVARTLYPPDFSGEWGYTDNEGRAALTLAEAAVVCTVWGALGLGGNVSGEGTVGATTSGEVSTRTHTTHQASTTGCNHGKNQTWYYTFAGIHAQDMQSLWYDEDSDSGKHHSQGPISIPVARLMQLYLVRFAGTGVPGAGWPAVFARGEVGVRMHFGDSVGECGVLGVDGVGGGLGGKCGFWRGEGVGGGYGVAG